MTKLCVSVFGHNHQTLHFHSDVHIITVKLSFSGIRFPIAGSILEMISSRISFTDIAEKYTRTGWREWSEMKTQRAVNRGLNRGAFCRPGESFGSLRLWGWKIMRTKTWIMLNLQRKEIQTNEKEDQVEFNALPAMSRHKVPATTQLKNRSSANDSSRGYFFHSKQLWFPQIGAAKHLFYFFSWHPHFLLTTFCTQSLISFK